MSPPRALLPLLPLALAVPPALAQCTPMWDTAIGTPGIGDSGYIQPIVPWTDAKGPAIYAGGSFGKIGGKAIDVVARYDTAAGTWSKMGSGINIGNTNGFATSLALFNPGGGDQLVVGGFFTSAGGQSDTQSLAMWNGSAWSSLSAGLVHDNMEADAVWSLLATGALGGHFLYVGGQFPNIGGQPAYGIASWDGQRWTGLSHSPLVGFSPSVFSLAEFDDGSGPAIYAGGRFSTIDGVSAPILARWDGSQWTKVGNGLSAEDQFAMIATMTVFDDGSGPALYIGGYEFHPSGLPSTSVAKWDGTKWANVGQKLGTGIVEALAVFDDGNGPALYQGGPAQPDIKYLAKLVGGQWVTVGTGIDVPNGPPFPGVFGLAATADSLYIGGAFPAVDGATASGIIRLAACVGACYPDFTGDGVLDLFDFLAYVNAFNAGDAHADCDENGGLDLFDFLCFVNAFNKGC